MSSPGVHTISDMQLGKSISEFLGVWTNPDMVLVICLYFCWLCIYIYTYMHIHIPNFYCVELLSLMDEKGDLMAFDSHFSGEEMQLFWLHIFSWGQVMLNLHFSWWYSYYSYSYHVPPHFSVHEIPIFSWSNPVFLPMSATRKSLPKRNPPSWWPASLVRPWPTGPGTGQIWYWPSTPYWGSSGDIVVLAG